MAGRPRSRQRNVSGTGKGIGRRGSGLGTGRVGSSGGYSGRPGRIGNSGGGVSGGSFGGGYSSGSGRRSTPPSGGKILSLVLAFIFFVFVRGGGMGLIMNNEFGIGDMSSAIETMGGGSISSGWDNGSNAGVLNTSVDAGAREKYTKILGNGEDEVTLMVYLCGTDLESRSKMATSDIQEMIAADISDNVNVIVYTGGCRSWQNNAFSSQTNQIWQVTNKGVTCLEKDLGSKSMTDEETLSSFIKWCAKKFPANRNMLVMWDHGGGSVSGFGYDEKFASS